MEHADIRTYRLVNFTQLSRYMRMKSDTARGKVYGIQFLILRDLNIIVLVIMPPHKLMWELMVNPNKVQIIDENTNTKLLAVDWHLVWDIGHRR